ncbi:hypothetical protein [Euzebya sp.]|uniref:hypothetical protein n=1 Tax=Euzebya sp. TaxID=1971409 RepID=UPI003516E8A0
MASPSPTPPPARARVPAHAWAWLQRSRSVLNEIAEQLYGTHGDSHTLEKLKADHAADPFVQDLVARVVCDVAFNGRVPERRPAGARWDRGLTWWAAHLAGVTPTEFEARSAGTAPPQQVLFGAPPPAPEPVESRPTRRKPLVSVERRAMVQALRDVLAAGDGHQVPADAVRALIEQLEGEE